MRYGPLASVILAGACLSLSQASAQPRPGWVDPPAKPAAEPQRTPPAAEAPKEPVAAARPAGPSEAPATVAEGRPTPRARTLRRREAAREARARDERPIERDDGRRLARTPPLAPPPAAPEAPDPRYAGWASAAQRLTLDYLDSVSGPDSASIVTARRFYAERVRRFGRTVPLAAIVAEKRSFAARWPERRYEAQGGTRTACSAAAESCLVRTVYDYRADAPARGARSQGTAELVLEISFAGERPLIVSESSRVLRRYGPGPLSAALSARSGA